MSSDHAPATPASGVGSGDDLVRQTAVVEGFRITSVHAGTGEPLVLLHGLAGSHRWWRFSVAALADRFSVHVPELVGFGGSRPAPRQPDIPEMADLLAAWLLDVVGEPAFVVGHSLGAEVSIHLAARHSACVRGLVLVSAAGVPRGLSPGDLLRTATRFGRPRAWGEPRFLPTIAADAARAGPWTLLAVTRQILSDDVRPLLPRITCPTLLVWGEDDPLTPVRDGRVMESALPLARLVIVPGAAHNVMADRPALFNRIVLDFLDEHADRDA